MPTVDHVHVVEHKDGRRYVKPGKGDGMITEISMRIIGDHFVPTGDTSLRRVDYWELPEPMRPAEALQWIEDSYDEVPPPYPVLEVIECATDGE